MPKKLMLVSPLAMLMILLITVATAVPVSNWQQVGGNGFGDPLANEISAVAAFNGYLYAGTGNPTNDARIFRSADGSTWNPVTDPGFGSDHDTAPPAIFWINSTWARQIQSMGGNCGASSKPLRRWKRFTSRSFCGHLRDGRILLNPFQVLHIPVRSPLSSALQRLNPGTKSKRRTGQWQ